MPKKKPREHLPKKMEAGDVTMPAHFGSRLIEGVRGAVRSATGAVFDSHTQGETMREKKRKRK